MIMSNLILSLVGSVGLLLFALSLRQLLLASIPEGFKWYRGILDGLALSLVVVLITWINPDFSAQSVDVRFAYIAIIAFTAGVRALSVALPIILAYVYLYEIDSYALNIQLLLASAAGAVLHKELRYQLKQGHMLPYVYLGVLLLVFNLTLFYFIESTQLEDWPHLLVSICLMIIIGGFHLAVDYRRQYAQKEGQELKKLMEELSNRSGIMIVIRDLTGTILHANDSFRERFEIKLEKFNSKTESLKILESPFSPLLQPQSDYYNPANSFNWETLVEINNEKLTFSSQLFPVFSKGNKQTASCTMISDISRRKNSEILARRNTRRFKEALEAAEEGIWEINLETNRTFFSKRFYEILDYKSHAFESSKEAWRIRIDLRDVKMFDHWLETIEKGDVDRQTLRYRVQKREGELLWVESRALVVARNEFGQPSRVVGTLSDVRRIVSAEETLKYIASHDTLTGLYNRNFFVDLPQTRKDRQVQGQNGALILIDIDHFKSINDTLGHGNGDHLLRSVARRIKACMQKDDFAMRMGGDEFLVWLEDTKEDGIEGRLSQLQDYLGRVFNVGAGKSVNLNYSFGISVRPNHGDTPEKLLRKADIAVFNAKRNGRGRCEYYSESMESDMQKRLEIEQEIRRGITNNEFVVWFQPKVRNKEGQHRLAGLEALVRWKHPDQGWVSPAVFLDISEETRQIIPLGREVFKQACEAARQWERDELLDAEARIAINISPIQLEDKNLLKSIDKIIKESRVNTSRLELEITESCMMSNPDIAKHFIIEVQKRGMTVAIDDFGTGYSSLSLLHDYNFDSLKVDMSFVRNLDQERSRNLVAAIVQMGKSLNMEIVAEGVETVLQRQLLTNLGCEIIQGYFYSKPIPIADATTWLTKCRDDDFRDYD
jgi:diguanylate cyclase (GGDEF)-like protein